MTPTHTYRHPEGHAFGEHHAREQGRKFFDAADARRRGLTDDEIAVLQEQHDLHRRIDLCDGTEVELDLILDGGYHRVEWTDAEGNPRATSIAAEFFASHFTPIPGAPPSPTHTSVQEHDYERGDQERPPWRPQLKTVTVPASFQHDAIVADHGVIGAQHEGTEG